MKINLKQLAGIFILITLDLLSANIFHHSTDKYEEQNWFELI